MQMKYKGKSSFQFFKLILSFCPGRYWQTTYLEFGSYF